MNDKVVSAAPKVQGLSIVLIGDFNPKIFQPAWFASEQLIGKDEADQAKIEVIHPEIVSFQLDWLQLHVTREKLSASTGQEPFELSRDLIISTFTLLRHTPLRALGINREMHFHVETVEQWHNFGHLLAPKAIWVDLLNEPGMRSLVMEGVRSDNLKGRIRTFVEPSLRAQPGVYLKVNDHYEISGAKEATEILTNHWDESLHRANRIIQALVSKI